MAEIIGKSLLATRWLGERRADVVTLGMSVAVRVIALLASMTTLVLSAKWLGPVGRGNIATLSTWANMGANIAAMSLGQAAVRHAAKHRGTPWIKPTLSTLIGFTALSGLVAWAVYAIIYFLSRGKALGNLPASYIVLGLAIVPLLIWEQYGSALLTLTGRIGLYNLGQLAGRASVLVAAAALVLLFDMGVGGFLAAILIGQAITALIGTSSLVKSAGGLEKPSATVMKYLFVDGMRLHLNTIGVLLLYGVDIIMLQHWRGFREVGIFQLASQIFITLLVVPQSALLILNSKIDKLEPTELWRYHKGVIVGVMAMMVVGGVILAMIAQPVIVTFTSSDFAPSARLLSIMLIALPAATLNAMMGIQWITRGWLLRASAITVAAGGFNVLANVFLIPRYGAYGAAWATVVGIYVIPFTANIALVALLERESRRSNV